ncbi:aspartate aminotransferase family protein [Paracoccus methylarcula]|nr:aspartate aminotransferase family protein [Paracoccus methylarcula]
MAARNSAGLNIGMANGFDPNGMADLDPAARDMIQRRQKLLGPAYRLMYADPVEIVRGQGTRLWGRNGEEYLDAYNNVASVGHCHPDVVAAVHAQMQTLCTHTRYLQDEILDFAGQILPSFGAPIEHIMFTCTGSEANDLALRIAMHHTGHRGVIVTSEAYTGNSFLTASLSPSLGRNAPAGDYVCRIAAPDSYRLDPATLGRVLARQVAQEIEQLEQRGEGIAAFIADSLFSSDGIYAHPTDILQPIAEVVHAAGGVVIADEVQAGFGRSGDKLWGYQRHGQIPDIVTMGKPMGNGFPVAAVAVSRKVVERFGNEMRYFNTFGGNTVAIAAARAVFEVLHRERLQMNAARIGAMIRQELQRFAARDERIGDVRGAGLYIGVEFVKDRDSKAPDPETALAVVGGLRRRRVLISATGHHANILKIRPPLVFSDADADRLLTEIGNVLAAI